MKQACRNDCLINYEAFIIINVSNDLKLVKKWIVNQKIVDFC